MNDISKQLSLDSSPHTPKPHALLADCSSICNTSCVLFVNLSNLHLLVVF